MANRPSQQSLSPAQLALGLVIGILIVVAEVVIFRAYLNSNATADDFRRSGNLITIIANVQSELLRLQIDSGRYLADPSQDRQPVTLRRAFVSNQMRDGQGVIQGNPEAMLAFEELQRQLAEYDALMASLEEAGEGEARAERARQIAPLVDDVLSRATSANEGLYDRQEIAFDQTIVNALGAQSTSQILLLGMSGLLLFLGVGLAFSLRRSVQAEFKQAYALVGSLEEAVAERTRDLARAAEVGQSMAAVRDLGTLLKEAGALIHSRFDLSRTWIFLADTTGRTLILRAAIGGQGVESAAPQPIDDDSIEGRALDQEDASVPRQQCPGRAHDAGCSPSGG
ncbi:MAG: hypothetical protein H0T73_20735 [Ardenticatenales bacterium]|nr:hypothetical protein [Ardenticatenales bacterium]